MTDSYLGGHFLQDKLLPKQTPSSFRAVLGVKVSGLLAMDAAMVALPLSSIMLFSSVSSIVAPLGQPNYAAANAMLNAWANGRSSQASAGSSHDPLPRPAGACPCLCGM